jgi:hypothetical protein
MGCESFKMRTRRCSGRIVQGMQAVARQLKEADQTSKGVLRQIESP